MLKFIYSKKTQNSAISICKPYDYNIVIKGTLKVIYKLKKIKTMDSAINIYIPYDLNIKLECLKKTFFCRQKNIAIDSYIPND